ncbi:MAG TPA: hypothetical protein VGG48_12530 [Rhizomicrobium sp.]|jgi:hypothetical protein
MADLKPSKTKLKSRPSISLPRLENLKIPIAAKVAKVTLASLKDVKTVAVANRRGYTVLAQHQSLRVAFQHTADTSIADNITDEIKPAASIDTWLAQLDQFVEANPGKPVSDLGRRIMPEFVRAAAEKATSENLIPPLPDKAPARWVSDRLEGDTVLTFLIRHYGKYMHQEDGMTQADLRRLDPALYSAWTSYKHKHHGKIPAVVCLPTAKERNDQWIKRLDATNPDNALRPNTATLKEVTRLASALQRRRKQGDVSR